MIHLRILLLAASFLLLGACSSAADAHESAARSGVAIDATIGSAVSSSAPHSTPPPQEATKDPVLTIEGTEFHQDGRVVHVGTTAEGLLLNARLGSGVADFGDRLPGWDPQANTAAFVSALDTYVAHGLNGVIVNFQGGIADRSWGEEYDNSAWTDAGTLKEAYASRMSTALDAMTARGIVPIVGLFYFRQEFCGMSLR